MADIFEIAEGFRAALLKNERAAAVRLVKAYGAAWNRISADLAKLSKQIDAARARGEIVDQWWLIRQERYRSLLDQITREMSRFADFAESQITAEQRRAIAAARNDAQRLLIAAVGDVPEAVAPSFNRLPASAVENLAGFLSNGSPLNRLLGEFAPSARQQIERGLMDAIAQGFGARKTATAIRKALGGNLVRALRIARTETIRAYRETTHQAFQSNADVMDGWYWLSARNARTCPTCWALHGTFHPISERLAGHVSCRCTQMPRTKSLAELGFPGAPDTRPAVKRGEDLFADQPADVQQQVLGAAFAAYRDGRIKLTDLVGRKESPQWGASYYTLGVGRALNNEGRFPGYSEPPKPAPSILRLIKPAPGPELRQRMEAVNVGIDQQIEKARLEKERIGKQWDDAIARNDLAAARPLAAKFDKLIAKAINLNKKRAEKVRAVLYRESPASFSVQAVGGKLSPKMAAGVREFSKLVGDGWIDGESVKISIDRRNKRESYSPGLSRVNARASTNAATVAHELGHWLEDKSKAVFDAVSDFMARRTAGESAVPLRNYQRRYRADEKTKPDKFLNPYMGKVYEVNGQRVASEVVSMGVELLYSDPLKLARDDPDYFDFIVNLLRSND